MPVHVSPDGPSVEFWDGDACAISIYGYNFQMEVQLELWQEQLELWQEQIYFRFNKKQQKEEELTTKNRNKNYIN
jgi:hypothetical protein